MSNPIHDHLLDEQQANGSLSPASQQHMHSTQKWTRVMAVVGLFISSITLLISFLSFFSMMGVSPSKRYIGDQFIGIAIFLIIFLVTNIVLCILLYQYSNGLKNFLEQNDAQSFGNFLDRQKILWTVLGVIVLVGLAFYSLSLLVAIFL